MTFSNFLRDDKTKRVNLWTAKPAVQTYDVILFYVPMCSVLKFDVPIFCFRIWQDIRVFIYLHNRKTNKFRLYQLHPNLSVISGKTMGIKFVILIILCPYRNARKIIDIFFSCRNLRVRITRCMIFTSHVSLGNLFRPIIKISTDVNFCSLHMYSFCLFFINVWYGVQ
jgi:hypothetical protein